MTISDRIALIARKKAVRGIVSAWLRLLAADLLLNPRSARVHRFSLRDPNRGLRRTIALTTGRRNRPELLPYD